MSTPVEAAPLPDPPPAARSARWMRVVLIASVALNLLFLGAAAGRAWHWRHHGWGGPFGPERILSGLPADQRKAIEAILARSRGDLQSAADAMEAARKETGAALAAEPFDRTRLETALKKLVEAGLKQHQTRLPMILDIAAALGPRERRQLAERIERGGPLGFGHWERIGGGD